MEKLLLVAAATLVLAACGTPGAPQPPSLQLPRPVDDLAAWRNGDTVQLSWTPPQKTTDGQNIRRRGPALICRAVNVGAMTECTKVGELAPNPNSAGAKTNAATEQAGYTDILPPNLQRQNPTGFAVYAVEVLNDKGRSAGLSNQVQVPLAPTLPPPTDLKAEVTPDGIVLTWSGMLHEHEAEGLRHIYRVYRTTKGSNAETLVGEVQLSSDPRASMMDHAFEWGETYIYTVTVVTLVPQASQQQSVEVEGEDSPPLEVTAGDVFAPTAPTGLQAVFSGAGQPRFIDLTWAPNTENDLAGYNVYRATPAGTMERMNTDLVKTPAFRDRDVQPGQTYTYAVTAVDLRGNESPRSEPASERVPAL